MSSAVPLSQFGERFSRRSAITELMRDLGEALASDNPDICMLGGGNPANIDSVDSLFKDKMQSLLASSEFQRTIGDYDGPQGAERFRNLLAEYLCEKFDWSISAENIALTNGSQNSFFYLFNSLAGKMSDGSHRKILLPMSPEYVGYADVGLSDDMLTSQAPNIELLDNQQFKYRIDFDNLTFDRSIAALCLSRPTNPTGNVVTDNEIKQLKTLASDQDIPVIVDNAYGQPFPNVIHTPANLSWDENTILCMSLSKLGLPGARTGIIIAHREIASLISNISGIVTLAPNSVGAALMSELLKDNQVDELSNEYLRPFYRKKLDHVLSLFNTEFADLPVRAHKPEGAFFLWLWCEGLPISSSELYQRLKRKWVYVIPGEAFFIDVDQTWPHTRECLRINYGQDEQQVTRGMKLIAQELRDIYS